MEDSIDQLIARLGSPDRHTRRAAERELMAMGPRVADVTVDIARRAADLRRRRRRMGTGVGVCAAIIVVVLLVGRTLADSTWWAPIAVEVALGLVGFTALGVGLALFAAYMDATLRGRSAAAFLAGVLDLRLVGRLVEVLELDPEATNALPPLLRRLRPEDAGLLNAGQRAILRQELDHLSRQAALDAGPGHLAEAIVHALTAVGDTQALDAVRRLAEREPAGHGALAHRLARECLPALERMKATQQESRTLLRASAGGGATELLRPASGSAADGDRDTLLRPLEQRAAAGEDGEG